MHLLKREAPRLLEKSVRPVCDCESPLKIPQHLVHMLAIRLPIAHTALSAAFYSLHIAIANGAMIKSGICFQWRNEHFEPRVLLFSVSNCAMNARRYWQWCDDACKLYRLRDEISVIFTPRFSYPCGAMNFMTSLGIKILIVHSCTRWCGIFKGLPKDGGRTDFPRLSLL
jgi:hypothetical protein